MDFTYIDLGRALERVSLGIAVLTVLFGLLAVAMRDRRLVGAARNLMIAGGVSVTGAAACLVGAFFDKAYQLEYVFTYSEAKLAPQYKFAGLWAGLDGSILFWAFILGVIGAVVAWGFRRRTTDPSGRRLEPWVYVVYAFVQIFFLTVICIVSDPFREMPLEHIQALIRNQGGMLNGALVMDGRPTDGRGLNPLLENYWMTFHPPSVYLGFILYTVPFAFGMAALIAGEFSSYWIRTTRKWTLVAWLFNTNGIVLGGLWAYEVLGWGGYWAWDPVENASFLPWLAGTAFVHSVMIQERRDMLRVWNAFLIALTFVLSIFGTYLTRSGIVSSVHAFGSGDVGDWFLGFLLIVIFLSLAIICSRIHRLRSANSIDSVLSREGVFLLNNMVLVAIAGAIVVLTLWPKISFEFLGRPISVNVPVYNLVCTPFFALLLLLTAIGPSTAWVRSSWSRLARNLVLPAIAALPLAGATLWFAYSVVRGGDLDDPVSVSGHLYPTGVLAYLGWFILSALGYEVLRTWRATMKATGKGPVTAFFRIGMKNNRRYGGYLVHVGMGFMAIGIVCSSMYSWQKEIRVPEGGVVKVGPYAMRVSGITRDEPVSAYFSTRVHVTLSDAVAVLQDAASGSLFERLTEVDADTKGARRDAASDKWFMTGDEIDTSALASPPFFDAASEGWFVAGDGVLAELDPERRFYPATAFRNEPQPTTEVKIKRFATEDFYIYFEQAQGGENAAYLFTIFRKPLINLVWAGWIIMLAGGLFAAVPLAKRRVGLAS